MKEHYAGEESQEPSMFDALLRAKIDSSGGGQNFAAELGVAHSTLWRWMERRIDPLSGQRSSAKDRLVEKLGLPEEQLQVLSQITVREACELLLETAATDPSGEAAQHPATPTAEGQNLDTK